MDGIRIPGRLTRSVEVPTASTLTSDELEGSEGDGSAVAVVESARCV
jgi:hypothetical protein